MAKQFFEECTESSHVKREIVTKYFAAWSRIISNTTRGDRIGYFDLYAGPGRYEDGTKSTPILILEQTIQDERLSQMLVTMFNDADPEQADSLRQTIDGLPGVEQLKHKPIVFNEEVDGEAVGFFDEMRLIPSLFFIDPWGYKGLSLDLVNAVIKDWACECIFFFNYNRISMGISNPAVREHIEALLGRGEAERIAQEVSGMSAADRELAIVEKLSDALNPDGGRYVLPFRFRDTRGTRTSHHLIFVSKHKLGYGVMKDIMARQSSSADQGVASFEYNPADSRFPLLFELTRPLDELGDMLVSEFAGHTLSVKEIYEQHNIGRPFLIKNYKSVIIALEEAVRVQCEPPAENRRKGTCADHVKVTFPTLEN